MQLHPLNAGSTNSMSRSHSATLIAELGAGLLILGFLDQFLDVVEVDTSEITALLRRARALPSGCPFGGVAEAKRG